MVELEGSLVGVVLGAEGFVGDYGVAALGGRDVEGFGDAVAND